MCIPMSVSCFALLYVAVCFLLPHRAEHHFVASFSYVDCSVTAKGERGRGVLMNRELKGLCLYRTLLQTLTNMLVIMKWWRTGVGGGGGCRSAAL